MGPADLLALAAALSMDAFAVAIITGLSCAPLTARRVLRMAVCFGLFQALMPVIGWVAGSAVEAYVSPFDHWVAFGLLAFVGGKMIWEANHRDELATTTGDPTSGWPLLMLSVATSIDALAVGLSLAMVGSGILLPAVVIGIVAAAFTATGMLLGRRIGSAWGKRVEVLGGLVLVAIGLRIMLQHLLA